MFDNRAHIGGGNTRGVQSRQELMGLGSIQVISVDKPATPAELRYRMRFEGGIQSLFRRFIDRADNAFPDAEYLS